MQRTNLELDSYKEKIKENQEKIKLNKQLPYLVGNIVEVNLLLPFALNFKGPLLFSFMSESNFSEFFFQDFFSLFL